jgi:hypothetical protein
MPVMTDLEKRRAEAIKAYQDSQAKAAQKTRERVERERQIQDKWKETSNRIVSGVMRASDNFAREGAALRFRHSPDEYPKYAKQTFDIRVAGLTQRRVGYLEFLLRADGRVLIDTSHSCSAVPETVDCDGLTVGLAQQIASEVMITVLNYESQLTDED